MKVNLELQLTVMKVRAAMPSDTDATCTNPLQDIGARLMPGRTISHYTIQSKLGEGGMGVVYQALDLRLHRPVALKFLHPKLTHSREQIAGLEREALSISALNHPNIATIYGMEEAGEFKFLVLEYLPGGTLRSRIERAHSQGNQIPLDEALDYAIQIAEGLAHAHQHGIIHRDIKSSNILFTEQGSLKLADFSLASSDFHSGAVSPSPIAGTPASMSPEQAQGKDLDHRSDIFSVGIVLFELLTGVMPFRAHGPAALLQQIINQPAPRLRQFRADIPAALESVVCTAMQKDRDRRYQQAGTLALDLRSVRSQCVPKTPEPAAHNTETMVSSRLPTRAGSRKLRTLSVVSVLLASSLALYQMPPVHRSLMSFVGINPLPVEKRLAVLNFACTGGSPELCDGLMDVISSKLTEMEQFQGSLLVISPSELRRAEIASPSEARQAFGATLAITGTVRPLGGGFEIMMNLVDTGSLVQLRSFTSGIGVPDPAALQAVLVSKAAEMLEISLGPNALMALGAGNPQVPSAYRYYVEGRGYLQDVENLAAVDKAISSFRKAVQLDSRYALAYAALAQASIERSNITKDPQSLDEALKNASRASELDGGLAEIRVTLGRVLAAKGFYEQAEREFRRVLDKDPLNAEAYRRLGRNYERWGRWQDAEQTYRQAIQLRPNDWKGFQFLGNYFFNRGNAQEAFRNYQRVLTLTPGNPNAYNDLGVAYLRLKNYSEAEAQLKKSVSLKATATNCSNLGSVYYFQGQYREAVRWYEKAVASIHTNATWWGNLADACRETPEFAPKAAQAYRNAISCSLRELEGNPRDARVRARLAYYYAAIGDAQSASREIAEALRTAHDDALCSFEQHWYTSSCTIGAPPWTLSPRRCARAIPRRKSVTRRNSRN